MRIELTHAGTGDEVASFRLTGDRLSVPEVGEEVIASTTWGGAAYDPVGARLVTHYTVVRRVFRYAHRQGGGEDATAAVTLYVRLTAWGPARAECNPTPDPGRMQP